MEKILLFIKVLGKTNYTTYKKYLDSKSDDEIINIKTDLEIKYSKWSKIITTFLTVISISMLGGVVTISYHFIKNAFKVYPNNQAMILTKGILPITIVICIFISLIILLLYGNLSNTKRKIKFIEEYQKERKVRKTITVK